MSKQDVISVMLMEKIVSIVVKLNDSVKIIKVGKVHEYHTCSKSFIIEDEYSHMMRIPLDKIVEVHKQ